MIISVVMIGQLSVLAGGQHHTVGKPETLPVSWSDLSCKMPIYNDGRETEEVT